MGKKPWWQMTRSRRLALAGAVICTLLVPTFAYALVIRIIEGDGWVIASRTSVTLLVLYLAAAFWINWRNLR